MVSIGEGAFTGCAALTIYGIPGSCAEIYAANNNIIFMPVTIFTPVAGSGCVVDSEAGIIYGLEPGITAEQFESSFVSVDSGYLLEYSTGAIGTGTVVSVKNDSTGEAVDSYTIIIFGDINGDGSIDSLDAGTAVDYENYMLAWDPPFDEIMPFAGDINGDGSIDSLDAGIMVDAENYMLNISQVTGRVI